MVDPRCGVMYEGQLEPSRSPTLQGLFAPSVVSGMTWQKKYSCGTVAAPSCTATSTKTPIASVSWPLNHGCKRHVGSCLKLCEVTSRDSFHGFGIWYHYSLLILFLLVFEKAFMLECSPSIPILLRVQHAQEWFDLDFV